MEYLMEILKFLGFIMVTNTIIALMLLFLVAVNSD